MAAPMNDFAFNNPDSSGTSWQRNLASKTAPSRCGPEQSRPVSRASWSNVVAGLSLDPTGSGPVDPIHDTVGAYQGRSHVRQRAAFEAATGQVSMTVDTGCSWLK